MLISYNWLQTYFATPLPTPEEVAEKLTFHSSEIEGVEQVGDDTVFEVKVLPDKSAWMLSHRGVAKELSVILGSPLKNDPLRSSLEALPRLEELSVTLDADTCDYYAATLLEDVRVGPSPDWLRERLEAVGQNSINNVVDVTNYVMLSLGQPLHAFDASTLAHKDGYGVGVRQAKDGEPFVSLTGEEYTLTPEDAVIVDGGDKVLALAGVKGGLHSGITIETTSIILEAAHFERVAVRRTATRHRLLTDASKRYENGISRGIIPYAVAEAVQLLGEVAGARVVGTTTAGDGSVTRTPVTVDLVRANSLLGTSLEMADVTAIMDRFDFAYTVSGHSVTVKPPFERDDLVIEADVVEEIGRIYGLDKINSVSPASVEIVALNKRHYYAEVIRETLIARGFSEVYTSSFRSQDVVKIQNALASDKGYLRSSLVENLREARAKNIPYRDLLGIGDVRLFEIGTVFGVDAEEFRVGLAVQTNTNYKANTDNGLWRDAISAIETALGVAIRVVDSADGVVEFSLDELLAALPEPTVYNTPMKLPLATYQAFSAYPPVSRDIALWVGEGTNEESVAVVLRAAASQLLVTLTHLDTFTKDGRTSLAFRLVFQANDHTLIEDEIVAVMNKIYAKVQSLGYEVR
jgi:phenylalanyl-tRNA synthetase beta chain